MDISVVIPVLNAEQWLEETLESVRDQAVDTEIIVVDDGSSDSSVDVARSFLARTGLTGRVLSTSGNQGPGSARNAGWQAATAEWIQFLDADDLLAPNKMQLQRSSLATLGRDVGIVYSSWQHLALVGEHWIPTGSPVRSNVDNNTLSAILEDRLFGYVGPTLIRRAALEDVDGFNPTLRLGEDFDLMLRLAVAGCGFRSIPSSVPLFFYRRIPGSLGGRASMDHHAVMLHLNSVREAELQLRRQLGELPVSTRRSIAGRYSERLSLLQDTDPDDFHSVFSWISDLRVRSAPREAHPAVRLAASAVGLSTALRAKHGYRRVLSRLRGMSG